MMHWESLLSLNKDQNDSRDRLEENEERVAFEIDYDRVVFSSEFRSLQDKTQVIPLSQTDFVHTRLTHSMEVSVVGRSLGRSVGKVILSRHPGLIKKGYKINDFGNIIASAALAHDIGNPPFGHGGEKAIGSYFEEDKHQLKTKLTAKEYQDLCSFEGNANGFRILTQNTPGKKGGFRLTHATLGAFVKYPKESLPKKSSNHISDKKFGFFQSEKNIFKELAERMGLLRVETNHIQFARHPLVYLVEAADDICYSIIDFEDGVNLGLIQEKEAEDCLMQIANKRINLANYKLLKNKQDRIGYLRAVAISCLIEDVTTIFLHNEQTILQHGFSKALLDHSSHHPSLSHILKISKQRIYESDEVIEKEIAGYTILQTLLDAFITAFIRHINGFPTSYDHLILLLLPKKYLVKDNLYLGLIQICAFIAGLSDGRVVALHKKIAGVSF